MASWISADVRTFNAMFSRSVSGYLKLGGQVVMWGVTAAAPQHGGTFYSSKNWVGNCPSCPPATYAPDLTAEKLELLRLTVQLPFLPIGCVLFDRLKISNTRCLLSPEYLTQKKKTKLRFSALTQRKGFAVGTAD